MEGPKVFVMDVLGTHLDPDWGTTKPNCKMRIAQDSSGQWYCIDCGRHIRSVALRFAEPESRPETSVTSRY